MGLAQIERLAHQRQEHGVRHHPDGKRRKPGGGARIDDAVAALEAAPAGQRHVPGGDLGRQLVGPGVLHAGPGLEAGRHHAGAHRRHRDAAVPDLLGQRLAERQHVGLGGVVHRHVGAGQQAGERRDIDDAAPALASQQAGEEAQRQLGQRPDIDVDHAELVVEGHVGRRAEQAVAGVVDDHVGVRPRRSKVVGKGRAGAPFAEVEGDRHDGGFVLAGQHARDAVELGFAARHDDEPVALPRQQLGKGLADPPGGAGDERELAGTAPCPAVHAFPPLWSMPA
jgi:hypothetical protein